MKIRLVAFDLDGTLLDTNKKISERTEKALLKAADSKVILVSATGRTYTAIPETVKSIKGLRYIISSNGATIYDNVKKEIIYSDSIREEAVERIYEILKHRKLMVEVSVGGVAYTDSFYYNMAKLNLLSYRTNRYVVETRTPVDDCLAFMTEHKNGIENININFENQEEREELRDLMEEIPGCNVTSSFAHNIEIGGENSTKEKALRYICRAENIETENVLSFGDSDNDVSMLRMSGLSAAVSNGTKDAKEAAKIITSSNDEDGVAVVLEKMINTGWEKVDF